MRELDHLPISVLQVYAVLVKIVNCIVLCCVVLSHKDVDSGD